MSGYYQGINTIQIDYADKLLFFDFRNSRDVKTVQDYWQKRVDNLLETEDQPWFTKKEKQRMSQELHFLKQPGQPVPIEESRGIKSMYFKRELLAKYRKNELCEIGSEYIKFLRHDKMTAASTVKFLNRNFANIDGIVLMMRALDYINVPPTERPHWSRYEIPESQINF